MYRTWARPWASRWEGRWTRRQRARRRRRQAAARRSLGRLAAELTLDNEVAAELAGSEDSVLRELKERLGCDVFLRGNVLTLDGDEGDVGAAADIVDDSWGSSSAATMAPATIDTVTGALDAGEGLVGDRRGRDLGAPEHPGRAQDHQPEALPGLDPAPHDHLRYRPGGHRQDLPRRGGGRRRRSKAAAMARIILTARPSRPASASASCRRPPGKVDPHYRPLFDTLYDMLDQGASPPISTVE